MTVPRNGRANVSHVNMMTDTIIANLTPDGLRVVIRSLLASHPEITGTLERETRKLAMQSAAAELSSDRPLTDLSSLQVVQRQVRCMLGSGLCFQSLPLLGKVVSSATERQRELSDADVDDFYASIDHDIVQAMTAVQKSLFVATGTRSMTEDEKSLLQSFSRSLAECGIAADKAQEHHPFSRGCAATADVLGSPLEKQHLVTKRIGTIPYPPETKETFVLGRRRLPRIFSGLWQMSSPAWGTAPIPKIVDQISKHVQEGFTAFDMADHYGDAEIIFVCFHSIYAPCMVRANTLKGHFWSAWPHKDAIFTATKYCVFHAMTSVTREGIQAAVTERCQRLQQSTVDLLQFHWQHVRGWIDPRFLMIQDILTLLLVRKPTILGCPSLSR